MPSPSNMYHRLRSRNQTDSVSMALSAASSD
jgi:hypothetical protein